MKRALVALLSVALCLLVTQPGQAATVTVGRKCTAINQVVKQGGKEFVCTSVGGIKLWKIKNSKSPVIPITSGLSAAALAQSAEKALKDPSRLVPITTPGDTVKITAFSQSGLMNFVAGEKFANYTYFGPRPLVETESNRKGAVTQITQDGRMTFGSKFAIPQWGVGFKIHTATADGRITVTTSSKGQVGFSRGDIFSWRLAYKKEGQNWHYQSPLGVSHQNNNTSFTDLVQLGSAGNYEVVLELPWNSTFYGVGLDDPESSITKLSNEKPLDVMIIGDSWTWPIINDTTESLTWDGYPAVLSWLSGWNVIAAGVPSQGYLQSAFGEKYLDRSVRDVALQMPDVLIYTGSPNDHLFTAQQISDEMQKNVKAAHASSPKTLIIVCSPFTANPDISRAIASFTKATNVPYLDFTANPIFTEQNNSQNELLFNGHPTRAGGMQIAKKLLLEISKLK